MKEIEESLKKDVLADHQYVVDLRRYFHSHPELSKHEYKTAERIEKELHKIGLETKRVSETGVYTEIKGNLKGDKVILLRADIDALPIQEARDTPYKSQKDGVMHACGHDAHAASLIGAARVLVKNKDKFGGKIILNFQQGEEIGYGARQFIDQGYVDEAQRTFGLHMKPDYKVGEICLTPGPNNASVDYFKITVHGLSSHVSKPEAGVDALYIASQIVIGIQALITRRNNPMDSILIGIGKMSAGTSYNIVAGEAELEGTLRAYSSEIRQKTIDQIKDLAEKTAAIYGGTISFIRKDFTSPLINDKESTEETQKVAFRLFGKENVITDRKPECTGDDMAEYIIKRPGCYAFVGSRNDNRPETAVSLHNDHFDIDEDAMITSVLIHCAYAIEFLNGEID